MKTNVERSNEVQDPNTLVDSSRFSVENKYLFVSIKKQTS